MMSSEFSYDKLKRKLHDDGLKDTLIAAGDLLTRKRFGRPVFDSAVKRGSSRRFQETSCERTLIERFQFRHQRMRTRNHLSHSLNGVESSPKQG